jgi:hypothetical protein
MPLDTLPEHVDESKLLPDPSGRYNHVYYPPTDEVFAVTAAEYLDLFPRGSARKASEAAGQGNDATVLQMTEEANKPIDLPNLQVTHDIDELRAKAKELGLDAPADASAEGLLELINQALIAGVKPKDTATDAAETGKPAAATAPKPAAVPTPVAKPTPPPPAAETGKPA